MTLSELPSVTPVLAKVALSTVVSAVLLLAPGLTAAPRAGAEPLAAPSAWPPRGTCPNPPAPNAPKLPHGALAMYCVPPNWNGDLVIWAHGYVDVTQPIGLYHLFFPDGHGGEVYLPDVVESLGFAFATTSYRTNGLAILTGVEDIEELVDNFSAATGKPKPTHTYQTGASEGGIVSTLLAERSPHRFSGALAACGPIGNFEWQINYVGDMRVLFDYYYPGVLPGSPLQIPDTLMKNWETVYRPAVERAITANPDGIRQIYRILFAAVQPDPAQLASTAVDVLWYNVFGTNDAAAKLKGNPYSNVGRWYFGSTNDLALNLAVPRVAADPVAVRNIEAYQTSGRVTIPLVTLHTTGDDIIPYGHEVLYFFKALGKTKTLTQLPVDAYGHCHFTLNDVLGAFALLVLQVAFQPVPGVTPTDPNTANGVAIERHIQKPDGLPAAR